MSKLKELAEDFLTTTGGIAYDQDIRKLAKAVIVLSDALEKPYVCDVCGERETEKWGKSCGGSEGCCHFVVNFQNSLTEAERIAGGE